MRKGKWSAAAVVMLLSGAALVLGGPPVLGADAGVAMVEGSQSDPSSWKFAPVEVTVSVGSTVTWRNDGEQQHDAKAEDNSFASPLLDPDETFQFKFTTPGDFKYYCEPHRALGMTGVVHVVGASTPTTPTTAATTTTTTAPAAGAATTTTAKGAGATTTTTTTATGATTTTTTAAAGATTTTLAPSTTPTSAPDTAGVTTTTAVDGHGEEAAAGGHGSSGGEDTNALGVAFAGVLTLILGSISVKLLVAKA